MNIPNRAQQESKQKWIGLARVEPRPKNDALGKATGAFVASIALAGNSEDFVRKTTEALNNLGFDVLEIEDIELFENRAQRHAIAPDVLRLAEVVNEEMPVALAAFHSYQT
jgi:hypothetical protein